MGNICSTKKKEVVPPIRSRKDNNLDSSLNYIQKLSREESLNHENPSKPDSLQTIDTLPMPSLKNRIPSFEQKYEGDHKLMPTNSSNETNANSLSSCDDMEMKKGFHYKKGPSIGRGLYGEVYECLHMNSGELLAVKSLKVKGDMTQLKTYVEALKKEIIALKELYHPNIVRYYAIDIYEVKGEQYSIVDIISEYVSGGSIKVLLDKFTRLDEKVASNYIIQVLEGLAYLHSNDIVHRNIKSSNVLIDASGVAKLTDFGSFKNLNKFIDQKLTAQSQFAEGIYWTAPEVLMKKSQGKSSDIWSVGCVLLEMLSGNLPWKELSSDPDQIYKLIISGTPPPIPEFVSEHCQDFLKSIFQFKPEERPSALELLEHPFITDRLLGLPSLTCLDIDSLQNSQNLMVKSLEKIPDDIHQDKENKGDLPQNGSARMNHSKLTINVVTTKAASQIGHQHHNNFFKSELNQIPEENSIEISNSRVVVGEPDSAMYKISNSPIFTNSNKIFLTHSPIKNCFFYEPNSDKFMKNQSNLITQNQASDSKPKNTNNEELVYIQGVSGEIGEIQKLAEKDETSLGQNNISKKEPEELPLSKSQLRRQYEQQMEREMLEMNLSNNSGLWGKNSQTRVQT